MRNAQGCVYVSCWVRKCTYLLHVEVPRRYQRDEFERLCGWRLNTETPRLSIAEPRRSARYQDHSHIHRERSQSLVSWFAHRQNMFTSDALLPPEERTSGPLGVGGRWCAALVGVSLPDRGKGQAFASGGVPGAGQTMLKRLSAYLGARTC